MIVQPALGLVNGIKSTGKNYVSLIFKPIRFYVSYSRLKLVTHMTVCWGFFQAESTLKFIAFLSLLHINLLSFLMWNYKCSYYTCSISFLWFPLQGQILIISCDKKNVWNEIYMYQNPLCFHSNKTQNHSTCVMKL